MIKGTIAGCTMFLLLSVAPVLATPTIDVGTHYLLPTGQQPVLIAVSTSASDMVRALDLSIQVGDGGAVNQGTDTVPKIIAVNIVGLGTVFSGASQDVWHLPDDLSGTYLIWQAETQLAVSDPSRLAQGTLASVTIDPTGMSVGNTRTVTLKNVARNVHPELPQGYTTDFAGTSANNVDGQIVIVPQQSMFWTGNIGNWTDGTWTPQPPTFPAEANDAVVNNNAQPAVVSVTGARQANSLYVGAGQVTITAPGSLHVGSSVNLNLNGTLAVVAGGSLTGEPSSSIEMSGGTLTGSGGSVAITLPVSVATGNANSLTTPGAADSLTINGPLSIHHNGTTLNKNGPGTLNIAATSVQSYEPGTVFNANAGVTNIASIVGPNLTVNASGGTVNFTDVDQTLTGLGISNGGIAKAYVNVGEPLAVGAGGGILFVEAGKSVTSTGLNVAAGVAIAKTGPGAWIIAGPQNFGAGAVIQIGGAGGGGSSPEPQGPQGVPEPSTLALLAIGAIALLLLRRRY